MVKATLSLLAVVLLAGPVGAQPASDYRARTIYFMLVDRFNPHHPYDPYVDPQYPDATNTLDCFTQPCPLEEQWRRYWGGDLQGIIEKLDYLQRLGVSVVWVTPLMENVRAYEGGTGYGTGYHGYWVQNYYRVNAHFGAWDDVRQLSQAFHDRGMRFIQDITLNHSNPNDNHVFGRLYQSSDADQIFINSYDDDYDPVNGPRFYKHYQETNLCQRAQSTPDSEWNYWQLHHCLLADLSGYDQRDQAMADYLINAGKMWIDNGVDDFRLDAIKFPFPEFVARFTSTMSDYLQSLHRPAPYIVGEWSNGGVGDIKSLNFANHYNLYSTNILDFQLSFALNRFVGGDFEAASQQMSAAELDVFLHERVKAFKERDTWQGAFIDNHDQIRTVVRLQKLGVQSETERQRRLDLATVLVHTVRGIPIIFYGDEQYLAYYDDGHDTPPEFINADNDDPFNRVGMRQWNEDTPAIKIIAVLANLRKESPAIAQGEYQTLYADQDILVFERRYQHEVVIVAVNRGEGKTIAIQKRLEVAPGRYTGVLTHTSEVNQGNFLVVTPEGEALVSLARLSSLVVRFPQHSQ